MGTATRSRELTSAFDLCAFVRSELEVYLLVFRANSGTETFVLRAAQTLDSSGKCYFVVTQPDAVVAAAALRHMSPSTEPLLLQW